jgi:hypothetical protein
LRKQWHQELQDKFSLQGLILEAKNYNTIRKQERQNPIPDGIGGRSSVHTNLRRPRLMTSRDIDWEFGRPG